jgi:hypothetical protein
MSNSAKNAIKHGCCAVDTLIMPNERMEDYTALENIWLNAYQPSTEAELHLVQELANADWLLQRATRAYANVESELYKANPNPAEWTEAQDRKLGRYLRYKTAHTNNVIKCQKRVETYRKARLAERAANEKSALAQERLKKAKAANPPADWQQHLQDMRNEAIARGFTPPES